MKTVALLTDFGLADNFVGVMKGVILKINPQLSLVDISHQVSSHDIVQAAFLLRGCYKYFAKGTIFLVVVDPGVGSERHPIIIRSKNYFFVGPDNGCLSLAAKEDGVTKIVAIENKRYFLKTISHTFHGRDIFAPAAAHLSCQRRLNSFGETLSVIKQLDIARPKASKGILKGEVVYIDRFGNLVTNIDQPLFRRTVRNKKLKIKIKDTEIGSVASSYQAVRQGRPLAVFGSFGLLEISLNKASAKRLLGVAKGDSVKILVR